MRANDLSSSFFPAGQGNPGSGPPYELKVGNIEKAVGCLQLIIVGFFSLIISCCISCIGIAGMMEGLVHPALQIAVILIVFIVVFVVIAKLTSWRFKKAYGKTAVLDVDHLLVKESSASEGEVLPYDQITSISIKKSRTQQLGYEFELANRVVHDLDPDLASFPKGNIPIENTVLPVVVDRWDQVLFENGGMFQIAPDASPQELYKAAMFWVAVGVPLLTIPTWWGTMADFFTRAWRLFLQAKYCGKAFVIQADGISYRDGSMAPVPLSEIRLAKQDDIAIVIESRDGRFVFQAPITARNAYTAGHWLKKKLRSGAFQKNNPPETDQPLGHGGRMEGLKSDLFE